MPFTPGNTHGALNGTTPVTLVAAPAASTQRIVRKIRIHNRDSAAVTVTIRYLDGATTRQIAKVIIPVDGSYVHDDTEVLDDTDDSITALMGGAAATTNPDFVATWADES